MNDANNDPGNEAGNDALDHALPPDMAPGDASAPGAAARAMTTAERIMLARFDAQRRLGLLRIIAPGLFAVAVLALPFAIHADLMAGLASSSLQVGVGVAAFAVALWATWTRRVEIASRALLAGVSGVILLLLVNDGPVAGALLLLRVPEFALLALPIAIAGVFGGPRLVALATGISVAVTLAILIFTPRAPDLAAALARPDGLVIFTIPLALQLVLGVLMFAANRGSARVLRELGDIRVAYAREKELERLKDQFIASVNHELRTPIMALQGYLEIADELAARGELERQHQMLSHASEAADHLAAIVKSVLSIRRLEADAAATQAETFALQPVIIAATNLLDPREAGERERELRLRVPPELLVHADVDRVRQVTLNLLSNAAKYSPPGSPIEVSARVVEAEQPSLRRRERAPIRPALVAVSVRDYGLGVPPDKAPLLFQRFVRLERDIASPVPGTGLGLAICRMYVEAMGGHIWVESSGVSGEGSTFTFTLPLAVV
jgi:signal transduction histidine kinase